MHHEIQHHLRNHTEVGHPMEPAVRNSLGQTFRTDLSAVRIHDDALAARLTTEFGVDAFAHGRDIYFAADRYRPTWRQGLELLAHEVAHVLQQAAGQTPTDDGYAGCRSGARYRALEHAACRAAGEAVAGRLAEPALRRVPVAAASRRPTIQFHSSFEHRALGDMDMFDIIEIANDGPRRSALLHCSP